MRGTVLDLLDCYTLACSRRVGHPQQRVNDMGRRDWTSPVHLLTQRAVLGVGHDREVGGEVQGEQPGAALRHGALMALLGSLLRRQRQRCEGSGAQGGGGCGQAMVPSCSSKVAVAVMQQTGSSKVAVANSGRSSCHYTGTVIALLTRLRQALHISLVGQQLLVGLRPGRRQKCAYNLNSAARCIGGLEMAMCARSHRAALAGSRLAWDPLILGVADLGSARTDKWPPTLVASSTLLENLVDSWLSSCWISLNRSLASPCAGDATGNKRRRRGQASRVGTRPQTMPQLLASTAAGARLPTRSSSQQACVIPCQRHPVPLLLMARAHSVCGQGWERVHCAPHAWPPHLQRHAAQHKVAQLAVHDALLGLAQLGPLRAVLDGLEGLVPVAGKGSGGMWRGRHGACKQGQAAGTAGALAGGAPARCASGHGRCAHAAAGLCCAAPMRQPQRLTVACSATGAG